MEEGTHLTGLEGTNPLGFFAALGVQVLFDFEEDQPKLWWSDDIIPHAIIDWEFDINCIIKQAKQEFPRWLESPALNPGFHNKSDDDAKFHPNHIRQYLKQARTHPYGKILAPALVAEGSLNPKGEVAKPTDFYFTSGNQKFLKIIRNTLEKVQSEDLRNGLISPWSYSSELSSLGWDITDDRIYALAAIDPAKDKKFSNPGVEALSVLGLSRYPVFCGQDRTLTLGCAGPWERSIYTWPLWNRPATSNVTKSLLFHATGHEKIMHQRTNWYTAWSISSIMSSVIRHSNKGYGTFSPPEIAWSRE